MDRQLGGAGAQLAMDVHDACWWLPRVLAELNRVPHAAASSWSVAEPVRDCQWCSTEARMRSSLPTSRLSSRIAVRSSTDPLVAVAATSHPFALRSALTPEDFVDADYVTYGTTPQPGFEHATFFAPRDVCGPRRILRIESTSVLRSTSSQPAPGRRWCPAGASPQAWASDDPPRSRTTADRVVTRNARPSRQSARR